MLAVVVTKLSVSAARAAPENLALHRPYVSSAPNQNGWDKPGLTDGVWGADPSTCYASDASPDFPKSATVDLGQIRSVKTVVLVVPPFGSTKTIEVLASTDNATFTPFGSYVCRAGEAQRAVLTGNANARYVRLRYPDHYDKPQGDYAPTYVFTSELEVYGEPAAEIPVEANPVPTALTSTLKDIGRHQGFMERIAQDPDIGLLFLGDSITDLWPRVGEPSWLKFAPWQPADLGIGGDLTEHLLWRLNNGELAGIHPKVAVILIGTNNVIRDKPPVTAAAIKKVVETVRDKLPQTKILLLGIFPRSSPDSPERLANTEVNTMISELDDGDTVRYLNLNHAFLNTQGEIPRDVMPDGLHPSVKGYEIWYKAMWPTLQEMLR